MFLNNSTQIKFLKFTLFTLAELRWINIKIFNWNNNLILTFKREMNEDDLTCSICLGFVLKVLVLLKFKTDFEYKKKYLHLQFESRSLAGIISAMHVYCKLSTIKMSGYVQSVGQFSQSNQTNWQEIDLLKEPSNLSMMRQPKIKPEIFALIITWNWLYVSPDIWYIINVAYIFLKLLDYLKIVWNTRKNNVSNAVMKKLAMDWVSYKDDVQIVISWK